MKIRSVRPEFFTDTRMAAMSHSARLLYVALWCIADDEGRGRYIPKQIEGEAFPHEAVDIDALLGELIGAGRVVPYEVDGEWFFHIPTFGEYQKPNRKYESRLPAPPPHDPSTVQAVRAQRVDSADDVNSPIPPAVIDDSTDSLPTQRGRSADAHAVEGEGEGVGEVEVVGEGVGVIAPAARDRNEVWDVLADLFGEPTTDGNRKLRGKLVSSLRRAGATYDEVTARVSRWPFHFPDATLTETALEKHWDRLGRMPMRATSAEAEVAEEERRRLARRASFDDIDVDEAFGMLDTGDEEDR